MRRGWNNGRRGDESFEEMIEALYELRAKCARLAQRVRELLEEIGCDSPGDQAREDGDRRERGGIFTEYICYFIVKQPVVRVA